MNHHATDSREFLIASDFDQTLSFNDSGHVLAEMLGVATFADKVKGLSATTLVNQGAELAYLLRHDPEFRGTRQSHLMAAGKQVRLKHNVARFAALLREELGGARFHFYVISAGPRELVQSALDGIVPPEHVFGTEFDHDAVTGEIAAIRRVPAGYGKVAILQEVQARLQIPADRTIYVGDGSSDLQVMHDLNSRDGHTIAVSETKSIARVASRTVLSDDAMSVFIPILEDILEWNPRRIREFFAQHGFALREWDKAQTDWISFQPMPERLAS